MLPFSPSRIGPSRVVALGKASRFEQDFSARSDRPATVRHLVTGTGTGTASQWGLVRPTRCRARQQARRRCPRAAERGDAPPYPERSSSAPGRRYRPGTVDGPGDRQGYRPRRTSGSRGSPAPRPSRKEDRKGRQECRWTRRPQHVAPASARQRAGSVERVLDGEEREAQSSRERALPPRAGRLSERTSSVPPRATASSDGR